MKKAICVLLVIVMMVSITGCGKKVPDGFTEETYNLGNDALKVMDSFLSGAIVARDAEKELSIICNGLDAATIEPDPNSKNYGDELFQNFTTGNISFLVSSFVIGMYDWKSGYGNSYDCQEIRDRLYEEINPKK